LVSTTIIESGLDVPNANTIFINNANNFGLSDLHQMRGRVGRSNKKAFCYFICPPYSMMTEDARKRIQALEQYSELGSGFNIAMKDLEIRGAGDLLGGEQSGFINEIGFETYQKIMNEAIEELKENEFKDLYESEDPIEKEYVKDLQIDSDFELLFPDNYINNISERLNLYNELSLVKTDEELKAYETKLVDRFGPLPKPAVSLLSSIKIKWIASQIGIEKLVMKQGKMIGYFFSNQQSDYYTSTQFHHVLQFVQTQSQLCKMKEKQTPNGLRLLVTFENVKSIRRALELMELMGK
jgi:transcription-repair coupling factor (superfamily II helicase)